MLRRDDCGLPLIYRGEIALTIPQVILPILLDNFTSERPVSAGLLPDRTASREARLLCVNFLNF